MCYKQEREDKDALKIEEKIKNYPKFLQDYFGRLPANSTKNSNFSPINDLLQWFIENNIIEKDCISDIETDDMKIITDLHVTNYLDELKKNYAIGTIINKKNIFSSLWDYFKAYKIVEDNVIKKIAKNKYKDEGTEDEDFDNVEIPTVKQIYDLMTNLYNLKNEFLYFRNVAMMILLAGTGMRSEELIGIDVDGIFLDEPQPYVLTMRKGYLKVRKKIKIRPEAINYVLPYIEIRKRIETDDKALFLSTRKQRLAYTSLKDVFTKLSNGIRPHMMRHMFASDMHAKGVSLVEIQKMMGHKSYETTSNMYISIDHEKDFFEVLKQVDEEFDNPFGEQKLINNDNNVCTVNNGDDNRKMLFNNILDKLASLSNDDLTKLLKVIDTSVTV